MNFPEYCLLKCDLNILSVKQLTVKIKISCIVNLPEKADDCWEGVSKKNNCRSWKSDFVLLIVKGTQLKYVLLYVQDKNSP